MGGTRTQTVALALVAVVFSLGLTFASVELPRLLDAAIQSRTEHPAVDSHGSSSERFRTELFIRHYHLRTIGYVCFGATLLLIALGFATRRHGLASMGAVVIFLPVFGQFALTMFYLAGLGLLNVTWLPLLDISLDVMRLGDVVNVPVFLLERVSAAVNVNLQAPLSLLLMVVGLLVFVLGVLAWMTARFQGKGVADFWLYRFSRHPQYLGWIVWSYGFMICPLNRPNMKRSWGIDGSLAWLLSTMVIIGVCLLEEIRMRREHGEAYAEFQRTTPFLLPAPGWLRRAFSRPWRAIVGPDFPRSGRQVAAVVGLSTLVLVGLSVPAQSLRPWSSNERAARVLADRYTDAELVELAAASHPRWRDRYFRAISFHSDTARRTLTGMLRSDNPSLREGAVRSLQSMGDGPEKELIRLLDDPSSAVRWAAISALGEMKSRAALEGIIRVLDEGDRRLTAPCVGALGNIPDPRAREALLGRTRNESFWVRCSLAGALAKHPSLETRRDLMDLLGDQDERVRRAATLAFLEQDDLANRAALERALDDPDWEVRLYAEEGLRRLAR